MITLQLRRGFVSWLIAAVVFLAVIGAGGYALATQPEHRVGVFVVVPLLLLIFVLMLWKSMALDVARGRIVTRRWGFYRRVCALPDVSALAVGSNGASSAMLGLKTRGPKTYVQLLLLSDVVKESLAPGRLTALADAIERFVPPSVAGRDTVTALLRQQAAHMAHGGKPEESPLAPYCSDKWVRAGESAGLATSVFKLLG